MRWPLARDDFCHSPAPVPRTGRRPARKVHSAGEAGGLDLVKKVLTARGPDQPIIALMDVNLKEFLKEAERREPPDLVKLPIRQLLQQWGHTDATSSPLRTRSLLKV